MTKRPLDKKVALVTGAAIRLGRAIATALAESGCDLILHYHSSRKDAQNLATELRRLGSNVALAQADLSKSNETLRLAKSAEKEWGRVDILINSAAVFWPTPLEGQSVKELNAFLDINLKSPYILSSEIGRRMKARGSGAIVNMACVSGLRPWKTYVPYSISKAGIMAMTVGMAKLLGPEVRVNAVAPGYIKTEMTDSLEDWRRREIDARIPAGRWGTPEDVARAPESHTGQFSGAGRVGKSSLVNAA